MIRGPVLPRQVPVLPLQLLRLPAHLLHLPPEGEEQLIGVVERVLDLLELVHVDVELCAELGFGLGEGGDLRGQLAGLEGFSLGGAEERVGGAVSVGELEVFGAEEGVVL